MQSDRRIRKLNPDYTAYMESFDFEDSEQENESAENIKTKKSRKKTHSDDDSDYTEEKSNFKKSKSDSTAKKAKHGSDDESVGSDWGSDSEIASEVEETIKTIKSRKKIRSESEIPSPLQYLVVHHDPRIGIAYAAPNKKIGRNICTNAQYRITCEGNAQFFTNKDMHNHDILFATPREANNNCVMIRNVSNPYRSDDPAYEEKHRQTLKEYLQAAGSSYRIAPSRLLELLPAASLEQEKEAVAAFNALYNSPIPYPKKLPEGKPQENAFFKSLASSLVEKQSVSASSSSSLHSKIETSDKGASVSSSEDTKPAKSRKTKAAYARKKKNKHEHRKGAGISKTLLHLRECSDPKFRYAFICRDHKSASNIRGNANKRMFGNGFLTVPNASRCVLVDVSSPGKFANFLARLANYHQTTVDKLKSRIVKATAGEEAVIKKAYKQEETHCQTERKRKVKKIKHENMVKVEELEANNHIVSSSSAVSMLPGEDENNKIKVEKSELSNNAVSSTTAVSMLPENHLPAIIPITLDDDSDVEELSGGGDTWGFKFDTEMPALEPCDRASSSSLSSSSLLPEDPAQHNDHAIIASSSSSSLSVKDLSSSGRLFGNYSNFFRRLIESNVPDAQLDMGITMSDQEMIIPKR